MDFFARLEEIRARWNVLEHPFYQRWSAGELTREELAGYAGEYHHAVVALADAAADAARVAEPELRTMLDAHAMEERSHVGLWERFTEGVGGATASDPQPKTVACARTWAGEDRDLTTALTALYTIESGQPAISQTKLDGLSEHYGMDEGPATEYFALHAKLDVEHAAAERRLLEPRLEQADRDALLGEVEAVLKANWELLDGVEQLNAAKG